jgi:uncharacterized protein YndB with AHSA1/START domain
MDTITTGTVSVSCSVLAPPEIVFSAWVTPELVSKWLFVSDDSEIVNATLDVVKHGKFSIQVWDKSNQQYIDYFGEYLEIDRPHKLIFTLQVPKHFPGETQVSVTINETPVGCDLQLIQSVAGAGITETSWKKMLDQLQLSLQNW